MQATSKVVRGQGDGDAPIRHQCAKVVALAIHLKEASMRELSVIGLDLAKEVFQVHGAAGDGSVMFRRKLRRAGVLPFFGAQPKCVVAMEACGAHYWGREIKRLGHDVRMLPAAYVKPFVKRQKNDAADAEAICEASQRPTMRFVRVRSEANQSDIVVFRARDLLVKQRTQIINAVRGHLGEFGMVMPKGARNIEKLMGRMREHVSSLAATLRPILEAMIEMIDLLQDKVDLMDREIARRAARDPVVRRLRTIPGIGPITAAALIALAPPAEQFAKGRDFAAWLGLTPRQFSSGGQQRLGSISKMGERTLRRLLIIGSSAVTYSTVPRGTTPGSWMERMLARKPRMVIAVALANKLARIVWALLAKGGEYRQTSGALL